MNLVAGLRFALPRLGELAGTRLELDIATAEAALALLLLAAALAIDPAESLRAE